MAAPSELGSKTYLADYGNSRLRQNIILGAIKAAACFLFGRVNLSRVIWKGSRLQKFIYLFGHSSSARINKPSNKDFWSLIRTCLCSWSRNEPLEVYYPGQLGESISHIQGNHTTRSAEAANIFRHRRVAVNHVLLNTAAYKLNIIKVGIVLCITKTICVLYEMK